MKRNKTGKEETERKKNETPIRDAWMATLLVSVELPEQQMQEQVDI